MNNLPQTLCPNCGTRFTVLDKKDKLLGGIILGIALLPVFGIGLIFIIAAIVGAKNKNTKCPTCGNEIMMERA